ncbi:hypothetical protein RRG08_028908 [Elysia crispata]|uniref:Uncharacterized protein n=1 Tax=Elysia crispata TaxID=231223 RepID=A0AAE1E342_9GAST|nr:hypothetical protein RRG08_028908 [Elysia crispata]
MSRAVIAQSNCGIIKKGPKCSPNTKTAMISSTPSVATLSNKMTLRGENPDLNYPTAISVLVIGADFDIEASSFIVFQENGSETSFKMNQVVEIYSRVKTAACLRGSRSVSPWEPQKCEKHSLKILL